MSEGEAIPDETSEESKEKDQPESTRKVIVTSRTVQDDYDKMVKVLLKQTGLKPKAIEGMTSKEAFDKLSFLAEHTEKEEGAPASKKNQKIVPVSPGGIPTENIEGVTTTVNPITGRKSFQIDLTKVYKK